MAAILHAHVPQARQVVGKILLTRIVLQPEERNGVAGVAFAAEGQRFFGGPAQKVQEDGGSSRTCRRPKAREIKSGRSLISLDSIRAFPILAPARPGSRDGDTARLTR
jgi:hypothetical protein